MRKVNGVQEIDEIEASIQESEGLPQTLAASFDAFEVIRLAARDCEDRIPALFPAFMTAAEAAVEGRECVTGAPSLPPSSGSAAQDFATVSGTDAEEIADALAALGALLSDRLSHAATLAATPGDQAACEEAADAARNIHHLLVRANDDSRSR